MFLQFICLAYLILEFVWVDGMVSVNAFASVGQPGGGGGSEIIKKNLRRVLTHSWIFIMEFRQLWLRKGRLSPAHKLTLPS